MKASKTGRGCGKSGMKDKPRAMLAKVKENVKILRRLGSKARSRASFSMSFFQTCLIEGGERGSDSFFGNFTDHNLKPYFIKPFLKLVMETPAESAIAEFNVVESIRKHVSQLKPIAVKRGLVCVGEYPGKILLKEGFIEKTSDTLPVLIQKASKQTLKTTQSILVTHDTLTLNADADTHFWFNVNNYLAENEEYLTQLKKSTSELHEAILLASLWDGLGSAFLPTLISQFKPPKANSIAIAIMPSKEQPADAHFNALASIGMCASNDAAAVVLLGRDAVEDYVGVDRDGSRMEGNSILNYLLETALASDTFVHELSELSRAFNTRLYTALTITGASFKVYGSFESMLEAAQLNPFLPFDLTTTQVLFVLVRAPLHLKDKLSKGKIELATAKWTKAITNIKSVYVSEPIYVNEASDRVDALVLTGGFNTTDLTVFLQKKAAKVKSEAVKKGLLKEKEWENITKSLTAQ